MKVKNPSKYIEQPDLFSFLYPPFVFTKPIRLIELFAGYGSQMMAMERLREEGFFPLGLESFGICEWAIPSFVAWAKIHAREDRKDYSNGLGKEEIAKALFGKGVSLDWKTPAPLQTLLKKPEQYLREAYNAMMASKNKVDITKTHGTDLSMDDREKYDVVMTWSFPCQSLSLAGKRAGMDEGSGSESSLGYEVLRILDEMKSIGQLPNVLIMENVPQFASKANRENVMKIQDRLGKLGYKSYVKIQSATDFGVPQTRKRCFMISVLGDYSYAFPDGFPLTLRLKNELEENADRKYYLSRKMMQYVLSPKGKSFNTKPEIDREIDREIAATIHADVSGQRAQFDNYISKVGEVINVGNVNGHQSGRVFSDQGCSPSVMAHTHGNTREAILTSEILGGLPVKDFSNPKGYSIAHEGDWIYCGQSEKKASGSLKSLSRTIQAKNSNACVIVSVGIDKSSNEPKQIDVANCITAREDRGVSKHKSQGTAIVESRSVSNEPVCLNPKGGLGGVDGFQPKYAMGTDGRIDLSAVYVTDEEDPRYLVWDGKEWRELQIRRLTPRECFRLQDVSDEDYELIKDSFAESTLYHLAGDSICVANLYHDFRQMCGKAKWGRS